jgi:hypothetical protein
MATVIPILRIFDYPKTLEFYVDWLGFQIDWEDIQDNAPIYMQISKDDIVLHLSEHYGDCSPGARVYIDNFTRLIEYHQHLTDKDYKYMRPGIGPAPWNNNIMYMEVLDPFGNRLTFTRSI